MISISSTLVRGEPLSVDSDRAVQISVVSYEHQKGIPARFCAGLLPALDMVKQLKLHNIKSIIRLIDPTPIANYCNGWTIKKSEFRDVIGQFLKSNGVDFFFDEAETIGDDALKILRELGLTLEKSSDTDVVDVLQRIKESGRKHGGDSGASNAVLYMAAHPFSWLDMHHPAVWKMRYIQDRQFVNLMSRSEGRFSVIRKFLKKARPDLSTGLDSIDMYMTVCDTPCYVPLEGEPTFEDLVAYGYDWCYARYAENKKMSSNHERIFKDFRILMKFLGLDST